MNCKKKNNRNKKTAQKRQTFFSHNPETKSQQTYKLCITKYYFSNNATRFTLTAGEIFQNKSIKFNHTKKFIFRYTILVFCRSFEWYYVGDVSDDVECGKVSVVSEASEH